MMLRRMWVVFFRQTASVPLWRRGLRPGFRHVTAASFFANRGHWVVFDPAGPATYIDIFPENQVSDLIAAMMPSTTAVLRFAGEHSRYNQPLSGWCVGSVKGLLGIRCAALTPWQLHQALLARGAEVVWTRDGGLVESIDPNVIAFDRAAAAAKVAREAPSARL
jgi:hypothetical protein